jgi:AraC-like DNA-binding protein
MKMSECVDPKGWDWIFACVNQLHAERWHDGLMRRLERARRFLDDHLDEPITLDAAARRAYLSKYHFLRVFRALYHETPAQYVRRRRIEWASRLLAHSELPVTQVCLRVGFESLGSFSSLFHREVGAPPNEFRRRYFVMPGSVSRPERLIPCCWLKRYGIEVALRA